MSEKDKLSQTSNLLAFGELIFLIMVELPFEVVTVDERGRESARRGGTAQSFTEQLPGGVGLEMVAIPGGKFQRGDEGSAQHEVTVPPFFLGVELTKLTGSAIWRWKLYPAIVVAFSPLKSCSYILNMRT